MSIFEAKNKKIIKNILFGTLKSKRQIYLCFSWRTVKSSLLCGVWLLRAQACEPKDQRSNWAPQQLSWDDGAALLSRLTASGSLTYFPARSPPWARSASTDSPSERLCLGGPEDEGTSTFVLFSEGGSGCRTWYFLLCRDKPVLMLTAPPFLHVLLLKNLLLVFMSG